ncbi:hypothetical protein ACS0TY_003031 [Phlomoides rotata]
MGRHRGFLIKHRVSTLFRQGLSHPRSIRVKPLSGMIRWANKLRSKLYLQRDYMRIGQEEIMRKPEPIRKGYTAVYVGQKGGDFERILVPVVHLNHPLFGDLLKESKKEYGYKQPAGGIAILCRMSEFERVQTRINTVQ